MNKQSIFEKELFELLRKHDVEIEEDYHTPYQQCGYSLKSFDKETFNFTVWIDIDSALIGRYESFMNSDQI